LHFFSKITGNSEENKEILIENFEFLIYLRKSDQISLLQFLKVTKKLIDNLNWLKDLIISMINQ